jgi:hypothetical protein
MFWIAVSAVNWSSFCWLERYFAVLSAVRASSFMHFSWSETSVVKTHCYIHLVVFSYTLILELASYCIL